MLSLSWNARCDWSKLAGGILQYGPLKFKSVFVAKMFHALNNNLKLFFTSKIVY